MSIDSAQARLFDVLADAVRVDEPMARHTSYRIGGPARLFVTCDTLSDLSYALDVLDDEDVDWLVVGKGSNLLVSDEGYQGAIVTLGQEFAKSDFGGFETRGEDAPDLDEYVGENVTITCGAACVLSRLVQKAFGCGLSGFEFAVGIPGTLGGALRMNAGTRDMWISNIVNTITTYKPGRGLALYHGSDLAWAYRRSALPADEVVVEASLRMKVADQERMRADMEASLQRRRGSQPYSQPSCGSVFRNPQGQSVGRLIEECGLKGATCGGAQVSPKHANFIVNTGSAKAVDVLQLMHTVRDNVQQKHGIRLVPEVRFVGFDA